MKTLEYRYVDKTAWGDGPWQDEPDKRQWTDKATGLPCLIVRGPSGALCGYVGIAEDHPWYGRSYSAYASGEPHETWTYENTPEAQIEVHGGLTFSDFCAKGEPEHGICHRPEPGEPDHVWWFGFDCAHRDDETPGSNARLRECGSRSTIWGGGIYRDVAYVEAECALLAQQLAAQANPTPVRCEAPRAEGRDQ